MSIDFFIILTVLVLAVVWDLRSWRIPNALTAPAALAGLGYHLTTAGLPGLKTSALGIIVGLGIFIIPYLLGGLGGGDVKLLGAIGAWLGPEGILFASFYTALVGGLFALGAIVVSREGILSSLKNVYRDLVYFVSFRDRPPLATRGKRRIPYSLAIAAGTLGFVFLGVPL